MTRSLLAVMLAAAPVAADPRTDIHGDPLPDGAVVRLGTIRFQLGADTVRRSHALSPDGKLLAVEDPDGIALWDTDTGRLTRRLTRLKQQGEFLKYALAFSVDGQRLARLAGPTVTLWEVAAGKELFAVDLKAEGMLRGIAFVPDQDRLLVTGEVMSRAWTIEVGTGKVVRTTDFPWPGKEANLWPTGTVVIGRLGRKWFVFDPNTGRERVRFESTSRDAAATVVSADGRRLLHLADTGRLRTFDTVDGTELEHLDPPVGWPGAGPPRLAASVDGSIIYLSQGHGLVHRRDRKAGKWLPPVPGVSADVLLAHPDGKRLLVITPEGLLRRYDLSTLKELPGSQAFADPVYAYPSPDGTRVAVDFGPIGRSNRLHLFDATGRSVWTIDPPIAEWGTPHWSPDGRRIACVRGDRILIRDSATGKVFRTLEPPAGGKVFDSAFFTVPGDRLLATLGNGRLVAAFDLSTGRRTRTWEPDADGRWDLSPDGAVLVSASVWKGTQFYDLAADRFLGDSPPLTEGSGFASIRPRFSPDGMLVVTWEKAPDGDAGRPHNFIGVVRNPRTGEHRRAIEVGLTEQFEWAFSPNALWLAVGTRDGKVLMFDAESGTRLGTWTGHRDAIVSIGFAGPGRVVTGSADMTGLVWALRPERRPNKPVWDALIGTDAADAWRAVWALADDPAAPSLLRSKTKSFSPPPSEQVDRWILDLEADRYAVREAATKKLQSFGRAVEPALSAAHKRSTSEEVRTRLTGLLAKISPERTPSEWAQLRAVAAMELAGTPAAKKLLAEWAAGAPGARLTADARAALVRLGDR